jgi:hypothetical protein
MKKAIGLVGIAVLMCSASVMAQQTPPAQQRGTMTQAIESVTENLAKNPQAPGLSNADTHLGKNAARHAANPHQGAASMERPQGVDRVERVERADRPDRPERIERPDRPERPDRVVRADRPEPPGRAKK